MEFKKFLDDALKDIVIDHSVINYIPIRKDKFLDDMKQFLYNYSTSGQIYPNKTNFKIKKEREDDLLNFKTSTKYSEINPEEVSKPKTYKTLLENKFLYNPIENQKTMK